MGHPHIFVWLWLLVSIKSLALAFAKLMYRSPWFDTNKDMGMTWRIFAKRNILGTINQTKSDGCSRRRIAIYKNCTQFNPRVTASHNNQQTKKIKQHNILNTWAEIITNDNEWWWKMIDDEWWCMNDDGWWWMMMDYGQSFLVNSFRKICLYFVW